MSQQATLEMDHDNRTSYRDARGETRTRRQQLGRSPYCRRTATIDDGPDLDQPEDHCQHCGRHTTARCRRVFGDQNDILWRCTQCATFREIQQGAGANQDPAYPARSTHQQEARADGGHP